MCAVSSVNLPATVSALERSLLHADFASCLLLSDIRPANLDERIEQVAIDRLRSAAAYSQFVLRQLPNYVSTSHCLLVQWDGFVLDGDQWQPEFLDCDYLGAAWPQFKDGHNVGNGGFSLRSQRLMRLCQSPHFRAHHPEDVAIGRTNRTWLEANGVQFGDEQLANSFSCERQGSLSHSFGFHGVFNMSAAIGPEQFAKIYRALDDRTSVRIETKRLARELTLGNGAMSRRARLWTERFFRSPFT